MTPPSPSSTSSSLQDSPPPPRAQQRQICNTRASTRNAPPSSSSAAPGTLLYSYGRTAPVFRDATAPQPDESASLSDFEQSQRSSAHGSPSPAPGMSPAGLNQLHYPDSGGNASPSPPPGRTPEPQDMFQRKPTPNPVREVSYRHSATASTPSTPGQLPITTPQPYSPTPARSPSRQVGPVGEPETGSQLVVYAPQAPDHIMDDLEKGFAEIYPEPAHRMASEMEDQEMADNCLEDTANVSEAAMAAHFAPLKGKRQAERSPFQPDYQPYCEARFAR
ncbi:hypothetical protein BJ508DRAFT_332343 [Ascobolus immersus RN42]|uniref:Uncharacterized protein n=1 Tax=Ascobolus immersus RN42 TaxID=1160509 RepID=A0A3N4HTU2_ASCIM|nr:hypothetical protein BJ508DRAFT_332343 [Ascobolus immersus RN42]